MTSCSEPGDSSRHATGAAADAGPLLPSASRRAVLAGLVEQARPGGSFTLLLGPEGIGKTTILAACLPLLCRTGPLLRAANAAPGPLGLRRLMRQLVGGDGADVSDGRIVERAFDVLMRPDAAGGESLLAIDDAQDLLPEAVLYLSMIADLRRSRGAPLRILFSARGDLRGLRERSASASLWRRAAPAIVLAPLPLMEMREHLDRRLRGANSAVARAVTQDGAAAMLAHARGAPGRLDRIFDAVSAAIAARGHRPASAALVAETARFLDAGPDPVRAPGPHAQRLEPDDVADRGADRGADHGADGGMNRAAPLRPARAIGHSRRLAWTAWIAAGVFLGGGAYRMAARWPAWIAATTSGLTGPGPVGDAAEAAILPRKAPPLLPDASDSGKVPAGLRLAEAAASGMPGAGGASRSQGAARNAGTGLGAAGGTEMRDAGFAAATDAGQADTAPGVAASAPADSDAAEPAPPIPSGAADAVNSAGDAAGDEPRNWPPDADAAAGRSDPASEAPAVPDTAIPPAPMPPGAPSEPAPPPRDTVETDQPAPPDAAPLGQGAPASVAPESSPGDVEAPAPQAPATDMPAPASMGPRDGPATQAPPVAGTAEQASPSPPEPPSANPDAATNGTADRSPAPPPATQAPPVAAGRAEQASPPPPGTPPGPNSDAATGGAADGSSAPPPATQAPLAAGTEEPGMPGPMPDPAHGGAATSPPSTAQSAPATPAPPATAGAVEPATPPPAETPSTAAPDGAEGGGAAQPPSAAEPAPAVRTPSPAAAPPEPAPLPPTAPTPGAGASGGTAMPPSVATPPAPPTQAPPLAARTPPPAAAPAAAPGATAGGAEGGGAPAPGTRRPAPASEMPGRTPFPPGGPTAPAVPAPVQGQARGPNPPPAPAPQSPGPAVSPALVQMLLRRGDEMLAIGDLSAARLLYERAAAAGNARAATAAGKTYDPEFLARTGARGIQPAPDKAAEWYRRGAALGDPEAQDRLGALEKAKGR